MSGPAIRQVQKISFLLIAKKGEHPFIKGSKKGVFGNLL